MHYAPHCLSEVFRLGIGPIHPAKLLQLEITIIWVAVYAISGH